MTGFLRFVGVLNAAVWCGSAIFMAVSLPALFSPDLKRLLTVPGVGFAAEAVMSRFFVVQYCCGGVAVAHLLAESFYHGKPVWRLNLGVVIVVLCLGLIGGLFAQPKMRALHLTKYFGKTAEQQAKAGRSFAIWHTATETSDFLIIGGLIWYLWRVSRAQEQQRFMSFSKIKI